MTTSAIDWAKGLLGGRKDQEDEVSKTTTGGGKRSGDLVEVYVAFNQAEAEVIKGFLESNDIPVLLRGEAIASTIGISIGGLAEVSVMVPEQLAPRAAELLEAQAEAAEQAEEDVDDDPLDPPPGMSLA